MGKTPSMSNILLYFMEYPSGRSKDKKEIHVCDIDLVRETLNFEQISTNNNQVWSQDKRPTE